MLLILVMLFSLAACSEKNSNSEIYEAYSCDLNGAAIDCRGDWVELGDNDEGKMYLKGTEKECTWSLDGESLVLDCGRDEYSGTLRNGVLKLGYEGMDYVFVMLPIEDEDGDVQSHVHEWQEADCENGKKCVDCGCVEGEPLGHEQIVANYQDPAKCIRCGMTQGEPLQPDMEKYGITEFMDVGVIYAYTTCTAQDKEKPTTGELQILSYEVFESSKGYPAKKGYEWHIVEVQADFFDSNAKSWGASVGCCHENYYNILLSDSTFTRDEESGMYSRMVSIHGENMPIYYKETGTWSDWEVVDGREQTTYSLTRAWLIPEGYDGSVMGFFNEYAVKWSNQHIYEVYNPTDFLMFRLNG